MKHSASCHCGNIAFEVEGTFTEGLDCNCSLCRRRGGLLAFVPRAALQLLTPEAGISTYTFHHHRLKHHFCARCGIAPFSEGDGPDGPMAAVNLRCLPELDLEQITIRKVDGKSF